MDATIVPELLNQTGTIVLSIRSEELTILLSFSVLNRSFLFLFLFFFLFLMEQRIDDTEIISTLEMGIIIIIFHATSEIIIHRFAICLKKK